MQAVRACYGTDVRVDRGGFWGFRRLLVKDGSAHTHQDRGSIPVLKRCEFDSVYFIWCAKPTGKAVMFFCNERGDRLPAQNPHEHEGMNKEVETCVCTQLVAVFRVSCSFFFNVVCV